MVRTYAYSDAIQLTEHFNSSEFRCFDNRNHDYKIDDTLVQKLESLFTVIPELFGITVSKIIVTSGYRCSQHDIDVLGTGSGPHVSGLAADICCYDDNNTPISSKIVSCAAQEIGFIGIANITEAYIYTHVDMKPRAKRWLGNEVYTTAYSVTDDFWSYYGLARQTNKVPADNVISKGIDVSEWQGEIDYAKVKGNTDFVVIRAGYGNDATQVDKKFNRNYEGFRSQGIPIGVYWYCYAISADDARKEAKACLEILKGKKFELPIFYDILEDDHIPMLKQHGGISKLINEIVPAFCNELEKAGYFVGVYCNTRGYKNYLNDSVKQRYVQWVADWSGSCGYTGEKVLWQYSSSGTCPGIVGNVDKDYAYSDFAEIKERKLNGWGEAPKTEKEEVDTPSAVLHKEDYPAPDSVIDIFQKILAELKQINENTSMKSEVLETITTQTTTTITKSTKKNNK